jgi:nuclear pore complex protein Nup210
LDGLPFEWSIINDPNDPSESGSDPAIDSNLAITSVDSRNVLRISKFIDSEYVVSDSIRQLESIGLSGNKILIEGLKTGTANVQAKLLDSFYKDTLKTPLVRLLVVANILLEPSYPIYILEGAVVKYNVFLIKQTSIEAINLPSLQYFFESRNTTVANLMFPDIADSNIIGINAGSTEIVLIDRNMRQQQLLSSTDPQVVLPPPTAVIHVVNPDSLIFSIKNWRSSWILEVSRTFA